MRCQRDFNVSSAVCRRITRKEIQFDEERITEALFLLFCFLITQSMPRKQAASVHQLFEYMEILCPFKIYPLSTNRLFERK
jgi:hypothetical protein